MQANGRGDIDLVGYIRVLHEHGYSGPLNLAGGKQVVVANKLLGTMVDSDQPGRSDVFDVAHAVTGGADMIMLTVETASGQYPVEAVRVADAIVREYEPSPPPKKLSVLLRRLVSRLFSGS